MRRRTILASVGGAIGGGAGYAALDWLWTDDGSDDPASDGDGPAETREAPALPSEARPFGGSVEVTPREALRADVAVTAEGLSAGGSSGSTTAIEALDGNRLLLLSVLAERSGSSGRFPRRAEFELVTESGSIRPLDPTGRFRQPIEGEPYSRAGRTGAGGRTRSGWLVFDVPQTVSTARLVLPSPDGRDDAEDTDRPTWEMGLDRLDHVDLETTLRPPPAITLADTAAVTVHTVNHGSHEATVFRLPETEHNGPLDSIEYQVPAGGENSGSTTLTAPGYRETIDLETDLTSATIDVEPIRADWGETWTDPNGLAVTCSNPTLADQVEHSGRHSPEGPEEGWQYLAFEVDIVNDTPEGEGALPIGTSFWAVVPADGEHETYHRDGFSQSDPVTIHSPIEGLEWTAEHSLGRGESAGGIVAIRIPDVRSVDDVGLRIAYSDSDTRDPEDGTLAYVGTDAEI